MKKEKKTDQEVVKKAEREARKNPVPRLKEHTTKPIAKPTDKRKKPKEKIDDGEKSGVKRFVVSR